MTTDKHYNIIKRFEFENGTLGLIDELNDGHYEFKIYRPHLNDDDEVLYVCRVKEIYEFEDTGYYAFVASLVFNGVESTLHKILALRPFFDHFGFDEARWTRKAPVEGEQTKVHRYKLRGR